MLGNIVDTPWNVTNICLLSARQYFRCCTFKMGYFFISVTKCLVRNSSRKSLFGSRFKGAAHHSGEGMAAEV